MAVAQALQSPSNGSRGRGRRNGNNGNPNFHSSNYSNFRGSSSGNRSILVNDRLDLSKRSFRFINYLSKIDSDLFVYLR